MHKIKLITKSSIKLKTFHLNVSTEHAEAQIHWQISRRNMKNLRHQIQFIYGQIERYEKTTLSQWMFTYNNISVTEWISNAITSQSKKKEDIYYSKSSNHHFKNANKLECFFTLLFHFFLFFLIPSCSVLYAFDDFFSLFLSWMPFSCTYFYFLVFVCFLFFQTN